MVLLGFIAMLGFNSVAQDVITLKTGTEIEVIVQEIGTDEVKYKKWDNQTGPNYTLKKSEVFMINPHCSPSLSKSEKITQNEVFLAQK